MENQKIFVTCEKVGTTCKVEAEGTLKDIIVLSTELLIEIGLSLSKEEVFDKIITPEDLIEAISSTAIENICSRAKQAGLSQ